jgi:hypothetical protein
MQPTIQNEVDEMIPIIFLNKSKQGINMCLNGIEDAYDLFCFCLDLFTKGLILLYGSPETRKVDLNDLTFEQLAFAIKQLEKANIKINIQTEKKTDGDSSIGIYIPLKNESFELEEYILTINMRYDRHFIFFTLQRYIHG